MSISSTLTLNNGTKIPQIGLGVWQIDNNKVPEVINWAIKAGYRHIDTAKIYGNEQGVGQGTKSSGINRSEIFVTTKLWASNIFNPQKGVDESLTKLGLDYVDLYLIHWPFPFWKNAWKKMEKIYKDGQTRAIGVSNFSIKQLQTLKKISGLVPAVNQVEISPFNYKKELIDYCQSEGIVVEAYSPLTRGKRLGENVIAAIAKTYQKSPAQIMIRWGIQHGVVMLPKSANPDHLKSNIDVFDFEINTNDMEKLDSLNENFRAMI